MTDAKSSAMPTRRRVLGAGAVVCGAVVSGAAVAGCSGAHRNPVVPPGIKGKVIAKAAEVPVGGGMLVNDWKILVTQPSAGVFKAFTALCPHRGCTVGRFVDDVVQCACHGSEFAIDSGKCLSGPAEGPLKEFPVRVDGDGIVIL